MHLSYNRRNLFADGCSEAADGGLSDLGREFIRRLNAVGIILDVPHTGMRSTLEAAQVTTLPMMASHTGCRAVYDHPRCKTDPEIKAIAETGGMIGIFNLPNMLGAGANINLLLKHLQHAVKVAGVGAVSIGTDSGFNLSDWEGWRTPAGVQDLASRSGNWGQIRKEKKLPPGSAVDSASLAWTNWPLFTVGLVKLGYKDSEIEQLLGGNLRRILDANRPKKEKAASDWLEQACR
jgi:membrane dipeptidase